MERSISPYERYGRFVPESDANLLLHTFNATETLTGLAYRYYGDPRAWRVIAGRNGISDPRRIEPGTQLLIPMPLQEGRLESL